MDLRNAVLADALIKFTTAPKSSDQIAETIATRPVLVLDQTAEFAIQRPFRSGLGCVETVEHSVMRAPKVRGNELERDGLIALVITARETCKHTMNRCHQRCEPRCIGLPRHSRT